jgi:hypothetical protein
MKIDIDSLNYDELVELNHKIVERLKFLDSMQAHEEMMQFRARFTRFTALTGVKRPISTW